MSEKKQISDKAVPRLVKKGEKQGYLTHEEIFAVLSPELVDELDELLSELKRLSIVIADSPEAGDRLVRERRHDAGLEVGSKDALSSYLREISHLPALDRETEIQYAVNYRNGVMMAMRAVVDARLFVDQVLHAAARVRSGKQPIWDVWDRVRTSEELDPQQATDALLEAARKLSGLHQQERRIVGRLERHGIRNERAKALSKKLKEIRSHIAVLLVQIPFEGKFLKAIATDMIALHQRLETEKAEREALAQKLGVPAGDLDRTIRAARKAEIIIPPEVDIDEVDRCHKNLRRRIRRIEKQAGMEFLSLHRAVLRYRTGILKSNRARDALILSAQKLVLSSARYYGRRLGGSGMEVADLISAGNLGLMRAVELFDPERGNRFSTFAGHWVRHAMIRTIHTQSRTVYVPPHIRQQMSKILAVENELLQKYERPPTHGELADASEIDISKLRHTMQSFGRMSSIDRPLDPEDSGSATYGDILADDGLTPHQELEGAERREMIRDLAERLQGRERSIVFMRMGWENQEPMTLAEIGAEFGISRQRVEQLEKRALEKLRRWARAAGIGDALFDH